MKRIATATWQTLRLFFTRVLVEPVREGRLRDTGWPVGLRPIVAVGLVGYVVAVALVLTAGILRAQLDLSTQTGPGSPTFPRSILWVVFALTALSVALGQSGALHARAWVRWIVTAFSVLVLLLASTPDQSEIPWGRIAAVTASIAVILLVALRGHRQFRWWEFAIFLAIIGGSFATSVASVAAASRPLGYDFGPVVVSLVMLTVGQLAVPAAIAAGASVTELAVSSAMWAVGAVRGRLGMRALVVLVAVVIAWRIVDLIPVAGAVASEPVGQVASLVAAVIFFAVVAGLWWLVIRLRRGGEPPTTSGLIVALSGVALIVAACLTLTIPSAFAQLSGLVVVSFGGPIDIVGAVLLTLSDLASSFVVINGVRVLGALALIVIALVLARRGRTVLPELLVAIGVSNFGSALGNLLDLPYGWTPQSLSIIATVAAAATLVWMLATRRLTPIRLAAVTSAILMAALFDHREFISDPLAILLGSAAAATVLVGFVWALLTGYGTANDDSPGYPRSARVQLVLANALFGASVLAYSVLARDPDSVINLGQFTANGAQSFGDALIAGSLIVALRAAVRERELA